jgi:ribosomal protein S18 acetylase RimI-like enzyme
MEHEGFTLGLVEDIDAMEALSPKVVDLMAAAFQWEVPPPRFAAFFKVDPRLSRGPHATYALDPHGGLAGFCGLARRPYCHYGGFVPTGHIWVFAVRQDASRRGLGRALFRLALDTYRAEGLEGVTLCTQTGLVAVELYRREGFKVHHRYGHWSAPPYKGPVVPQGLRPLRGDELLKLAALYSADLREREGWSRREGDVMELRRLAGSISPEWYVTTDPPGTLEGYVCVAPAPVMGTTVALEVVAPDAEWCEDALRTLRARPDAQLVRLKHYNPAAKDALKAAGYVWNDIQSRECTMFLGEPLTPDPELAAGGPGTHTESRHDIL